jgi:hypothetical protein
MAVLYTNIAIGVVVVIALCAMGVAAVIAISGTGVMQ